LFKVNELGFITCVSPEAITNGVLYIPKHYKGDEVVGIKNFALSNETKSLITRIIFNGDIVIENQAFRNCFKLEEISFSGKADIGRLGFADNSSLSVINFNSKGKETVIGNNSFANCNIKELTLPENTITGDSSFISNPIKNLYLTGSNIELGDKSFANCIDLEFVHSTEDCQTTLREKVFEGCNNLKEYENTETIIDLGYSAFANCKSFYGDENHGFIVTGKSEESALENTSIESLVYKSAQSVPRNFIKNNEALRGVFIYGEIATIKSGAFENCKNNEVMFMPASVQYIGNNALAHNDSIHTVNVLSKVEIFLKQQLPISKMLNKKGTIELPSGIELGINAVPFEYKQSKSKQSEIKINLNNVSFKVKKETEEQIRAKIRAEQVEDRYSSCLSQIPVELSR
jgi:hypothetical protein